MSRCSRSHLAHSSVLAIGFAVACSSDGSSPVVPPSPTNSSWRWMNPVSEGASLNGLWGPSADNLFASGTGGVVLRYDGVSWRRTTTPVTGNLNAVWGTDANHVIAVGQDGIILHYNGTSWRQQASPATENLTDVWGSSASDVFAVGHRRTVVHFDGAVWDTLSVPPGIENLYSVWGSGPTDVYATGLGKKLFHYDGASWGEVQTNASFALNAVWGTAANDVFAVGGNGAVTHFDGSSWSNIDIGFPLFAFTVWGTASDDVYAMGSGTTNQAYHWDGSTWSPVPLNSRKAVARVFGVDGAVLAVGQAGLIFEKVGSEFQPAKGGLTVDLRDVWVSGDGADAYAVGEFGTILHFAQGAWSTMTSGTTSHLRGLSGTTAQDLIAVGEDGVVLRYNGAGWSDISPGTPVHFNEVWMDAPGTGFVVGESATVMRLDGSGWAPLSLGSLSAPLLSVWGSSANNVYVVGMESMSLRWTGTQFKNIVIEFGTSHTFHGVYGTGPSDVFVAAEYLGVAPPPASPGADAVAPGGALHAGGNIFHWDGAAWTRVYQDPVQDVLSVWRANGTEGLATGDGSTLLRNGSGDNGWVRVWDVKNLPWLVNAVWGSSMKNVMVVGNDGTIVRYSQ